MQRIGDGGEGEDNDGGVERPHERAEHEDGYDDLLLRVHPDLMKYYRGVLMYLSNGWMKREKRVLTTNLRRASAVHFVIFAFRQHMGAFSSWYCHQDL